MAEKNHAPIAIFAFNRPKHLRQTIESLRQCRGFEFSPVLIFVDGPRNAEDEKSVQATRQVAAQYLGPRVKHRFAKFNRGLAASIIRGVGEVLSSFDRVIILEDDLVVGAGFLEFLNRGLTFYQTNNQVYQISGYMPEVPELRKREEALLLPWTTTWGWATWSRAWRAFDPKASGWQELYHQDETRRQFNLNGNYDYASMLGKQMNGCLDSWGIRWYWSVFRAKGLCCFPPQTLVHNTGRDGSGTHERRRFFLKNPKPDPKNSIFFQPPRHAKTEAEVWLSVQKAVGKANFNLIKKAAAAARALFSKAGRI